VNQKKTLHVVNGMEMYKYFKEKDFIDPDIMVPFNEAMCYGKTCEALFSDEFIDIRSNVHHVTPGQYTAITLKPLQPLLRQQYNDISLWFDADMFCQMNILTILAWLDCSQYNGMIKLYIVDDHFRAVDTYTLKADGYDTYYKQVLIEKENPHDIQPDVLKKGIERYLNYLKPDSDLMVFIRKHEDVPLKQLVARLLENFKAYGLGDTQYLEIIQSYRRKNTVPF